MTDLHRADLVVIESLHQQLKDANNRLAELENDLPLQKACEQIKQLEEALDTRQAVYDKLLDDYTKLLVKSKDPILKVRAALDELMRLSMLIRANIKFAPHLGHSREYLSGIEHAIATVEDYIGDVLK